MSEKQGKNSKSLFQKLTDMLNPQPGLTKEEKKRYGSAYEGILFTDIEVKVGSEKYLAKYIAVVWGNDTYF